MAKKQLGMKISKVGYNESSGVVSIGFSRANDAGIFEEHTVSSDDAPVASLPDSLSALVPHVRKLLGVKSELGAMTVGSVSFNHGKGLGCTIACKCEMPDGLSALCFNTPFRLMTAALEGEADDANTLPKAFVQDLYAVMEEGQKYADGHRLNPALPFGEEGKGKGRKRVENTAEKKPKGGEQGTFEETAEGDGKPKRSRRAPQTMTGADIEAAKARAEAKAAKKKGSRKSGK